MLYRVLILSLITILLSSCEDDNDQPKPSNPIPNPQTLVTITGPEMEWVEWCGPDFATELDYTIHVTDTSGTPLSGISVTYLQDDCFSPVRPADTLLVTDGTGDALLALKTQCHGEFDIRVIVYDDTTSFEVSLQFAEMIMGSYMDPVADTLYDKAGQSDSMEIRARLTYDWGIPASSDSTKFTTSSGYMDSTYQGYSYEGWGTISVYWYPTEETPFGRIMINADTKTICGQFPEHFVTIYIPTTTDFIYAPTP